MKSLSNTLLPIVLLTLSGTASAATVAEIVQTTESANVFVFVDDGVATLSGTVDKSEIATSLEDAVWEQDGVIDVKNDLLIVE